MNERQKDMFLYFGTALIILAILLVIYNLKITTNVDSITGITTEAFDIPNLLYSIVIALVGIIFFVIGVVPQTVESKVTEKDIEVEAEVKRIENESEERQGKNIRTEG